MTDLEALISMAQTALRARGEWCVTGIDETLRRDIRAMVGDCAKLLRLDETAARTEERAIEELERRAAYFSEEDSFTIDALGAEDLPQE